MFTLFILFIICTEAITELVVKSEFFSPVREFIFNRRKNIIYKFLDKLLSCGYCFSVWASVICFILYSTNLYLIRVGLLCLVIHRLSNVLHFVIDRIDRLK